MKRPYDPVSYLTKQHDAAIFGIREIVRLFQENQLRAESDEPESCFIDEANLYALMGSIEILADRAGQISDQLGELADHRKRR
ncbi:hypothetical protein [Halomonas sp.]|uniref:hypothetical protein n=1 Tax=Halomonas sp. TaxID=1486246 RepID=UPI003D0EE941